MDVALTAPESGKTGSPGSHEQARRKWGDTILEPRPKRLGAGVDLVPLAPLTRL